MRVLDVATGSGNAAIAAARSAPRSEASTTCPRCSSGVACERPRGLRHPVRRGRRGGAALRGRGFDAVTTIFGSMFAPDHDRAAAELLRVTRPGGTIAMASWTPQASSARCSRPSAGTCRRQPGCDRRCSGGPSRTCASSSARRSRRSTVDRAHLHLALHVGEASSTRSAPGTARLSRPSRPWTKPPSRPGGRPGRPARPSSTGSGSTTRSRSRRRTSRPSPSGGDRQAARIRAPPQH